MKQFRTSIQIAGPAAVVVLLIGACTNSQIKDTAETIDSLIPKITDLQQPASVSTDSATLRATFIPGAWGNNETPTDKRLVWSRTAPNSEGQWTDKHTITPQCQPNNAAPNAERCRATINSTSNGAHYFEWRYASATNTNSDVIYAPSNGNGQYIVNIMPPPPPVSGDPKLVSFSAGDPVCIGGTTKIEYEFDKKGWNINSNAQVCVHLEVNNNNGNVNTYGGRALACWGPVAGGIIKTWDDPTEGSHFIDLDEHYGNVANYPSNIEFLLELRSGLGVTLLDTMTTTSTVDVCD
ncbi:MAG: hypothetical protein L3J84_09235 [Gammaproteobacteria bacterium]|nr:hypothetical protein [Gammaproteobacteria bacterium]